MFTGRLQETAVDLKTKETQIDIKIEQEREKIEGKVRLILAREVTVFGFWNDVSFKYLPIPWKKPSINGMQLEAN